MSTTSRIARCFSRLHAAGRGGLVTFLTAGDPDPATSAQLLSRLPAAGADVIELGMPFSDPMADGPAIQMSSLRALRTGQTLRRTLALVAEFRRDDDKTPIVLMGYYNPIYIYGADAFVRDAREAGVDGLIVVDLPPEEADELRLPAEAVGLDFVFLTAPTTDEDRLPVVLRHAKGFVYYVSITGVTGTASARAVDVEASVARIRAATDLPIAIGFGIKTADQVEAMTRIGDAAVVGSALVNEIAAHIDEEGRPSPDLIEHVTDFVAELANGVRGRGWDKETRA
ncbi:MAG: tryptophan synthase subunit alpha [Rhodospirillales bacterium]